MLAIAQSDKLNAGVSSIAALISSGQLAVFCLRSNLSTFKEGVRSCSGPRIDSPRVKVGFLGVVTPPSNPIFGVFF